jgi:hypothetical protein
MHAPWKRFEPFHAWARAHGFKLGLVLVRIDLAKDFGPQNCAWTTRSEQCKRRRMPARRLLRAFGEVKGLAEWTRDSRCSVGPGVLATRLYKGWRPKDAISLPSGARLPPSRRLPRRPRARRAVDWTRIERLVLERGLTVIEVGRSMRIPASTIYSYFKRKGHSVSRERPKSEKRAASGSLYTSWSKMLIRTRREEAPNKLPVLCRAWQDFSRFRAWARKAGHRQGLCLVRLDVERGFEPSNCRFVTRARVVYYQRQPRGKHKPRWLLTAWGEDKGPTEWSRDRRCVVSLRTLLARLRMDWTPESAISTPPMSRARAKGTRFLSAFGVTKFLTEWSRDPRCVVTLTGLRARLDRGMRLSEALTTPPLRLAEIMRAPRGPRSQAPPPSSTAKR